MFLNITLTVRFFASGSTNESGGKWLALSALLLSIFFFTGCSHTSGKFENPEAMAAYQPFSVPVKFYVEKVEVTPKQQSDLTLFREQSTLEIQNAFVKFYPQFFAQSPENALPVSFRIIPTYYVQPDHPVLAPFTVLCSLFSGGLLPVTNTFTMETDIIVELNDHSVKIPAPVRCFAKGNIGPLALLLPTHVLIPSWGDKLFESSALTSSDSFRVLPEKMKDFLSVLVAALHKLPEDKVQKLYLMKNSPATKLLE